MKPPFTRDGLRPGTRLGLAVSGGADSTALLRLAEEQAGTQGWALTVLHVEHGLRGDAGQQDAAFVGALAERLSLPFLLHEVDAGALAKNEGGGLEEACRRLRYGWFRELLGMGKVGAQVDAVATGHTLDDQAETVLGKLLRGGWTRGLGGIAPVVPVAELLHGGKLPEAGARSGFGSGPGSAFELVAARGLIVRPLLGARRAALRAWLLKIGQPWREDETNSDPAFARNRLRHEVLPVLASVAPQVSERLAQVSVLARDDEQYWQGELARVLPGLLLPGRPVRGGGRASSTVPGEQSLAVEVQRLRELPAALGRRVVRAVAQGLGASLDFAETERAFRLLEGSVGATARREQLTAELRVERTPRELRFVRDGASGRSGKSGGEEIAVPIPGETAGFGVLLRVSHASGEVHPPATLRAARPGDRVQLRYSRGAPKRVKEVLERLGVPSQDRAGWPLLEWQGEIVWLRGAVLEPTALSLELTVDAG